jgi:hypothetical protein
VSQVYDDSNRSLDAAYRKEQPMRVWERKEIQEVLWEGIMSKERAAYIAVSAIVNHPMHQPAMWRIVRELDSQLYQLLRDGEWNEAVTTAKNKAKS